MYILYKYVLLSQKSFTFELWLNADILKGVEFCNSDPTTNCIPVEPNLFLKLCQKYFTTDAVLSPGFTTFYNETLDINHSEKITDDANNKYNKNLMISMVETLKSNNCLGKNKINFPLRAIFAINSLEEIIYLLEKTGSTNSSITIWGQENLDQSQIEKLKCLIKKIGSHKIYLDVHEDLRNDILKDLSL